MDSSAAAGEDSVDDGAGVVAGDDAFLEVADATVGHVMIVGPIEAAGTGTRVATLGGGVLIVSSVMIGGGTDAGERMTLLSRTFRSDTGRNPRIASAPRSAETDWRPRT